MKKLQQELLKIILSYTPIQLAKNFINDLVILRKNDFLLDTLTSENQHLRHGQPRRPVTPPRRFLEHGKARQVRMRKQNRAVVLAQRLQARIAAKAGQGGGHGVAAHGDVDALDAAGKVAAIGGFQVDAGQRQQFFRCSRVEPLAGVLRRAVRQRDIGTEDGLLGRAHANVLVGRDDVAEARLLVHHVVPA